jgi:hypothetical protein
MKTVRLCRHWTPELDEVVLHCAFASGQRTTRIKPQYRSRSIGSSLKGVRYSCDDAIAPHAGGDGRIFGRHCTPTTFFKHNGLTQSLGISIRLAASSMDSFQRSINRRGVILASST